MQAVEHRQGCQGNPDASRCLRCPPAAPLPGGRSGDGGCASAASALRGPCARCGCVGSDWPPRAARCRAPGSNNWGCSSAGRGRNGCTAGPGRSTERTGTNGRNRPCAPRGPKPKVLDGRVPASHTLMAPPYSARCRARHGRPAAKRWTAAAPDYFGIVACCTARGWASVTGPPRNDPFRAVSTTLQGQSITTCFARLPADQQRAFACMAALRATMQAKNSPAQPCRQATIA